MVHPGKILVIRLSSIGDILLTTPFLRVLRKQFPDALIDYVVKKDFSELLRHNPHINTLHEFDARGGFENLSRLKNRLGGLNYDLIIDLHGSVRSTYLRRKLGARKIVKINKRKLARFFLIKFKWNMYKGIVPVIDRYIEPLHYLGIRNDGLGPEIFFPGEIDDFVSALLEKEGMLDTAQSGKLFALCPSAKHYTKRWLREYYVSLGRMLIDTYDARVMLLGGPEERAYCEDIARLIDQGAVANLAGDLSLLQSAAALDHASLVVSNDTGLMHMATARKRPLVAIFGPTVRELGFFPYGEKSVVVEHNALTCRPCSHIGTHVCPKSHFKCMKEISPELVFDRIKELVQVPR